MTVQFILPEATSFPKERKLHDRLFLVLLYNLLCKTFKDHSSASAASSLSERNPLLQERCFPIASAKVEHSCIPCKRSPKKNARNFHLRPFCHFIALQNRQQSPFFRLSPTPPFSLQNLRFSRFSPFQVRFRAIFRGIALVFCPAKPTFSRLASFWIRLRTIFRGIFRVSPSAYRIFNSCSPTLHLSPPLLFSFLPTFPSSSPINARSCAPSCITCARVHPHIPARQEVFVYCLHRFTPPSQFTVHQCVRGEGKQEKAFTKNSITS